MRICLQAPGPGGRSPARARRLADDGAPVDPGSALTWPQLPATVAAVEAEQSPRWVWADTASLYPGLLAAGVRVARCHDLALTEALLLGHEGHWGAPRSLAAAWARLCGAPVPDDPEPDDLHGYGGVEQAELFSASDAWPGMSEPALAGGADPLDAVTAVLSDQLARTEAARRISPGFGLLVAAESASALVAVEMSDAGLPWRADVHDELLAAALGPRPGRGGRPARLQELAEQVAALLGDPRLNPDSPVELLRALHRAGLPVRTTRRRELAEVEHPVIAPLLRYKELARLHAAHGWAWREQWVRDGRFRPAYVPGGVVSGRWASRGGGALQIPRAVRGAVVADPGRTLIVADAGQLEPRVLAAISGDAGMIVATGQGDLYAAVAAQALGRQDARQEAKVALLSAMYGGGTRSAALAALRQRFPAALQLLEDAARSGEDGGLVRSVLGRTCPPPRPGWLDGPEQAARQRARARGRFTRNFVIQASAADWASVLLAGLRGRLDELPGQARLVFFQHDEVLVEADTELVEAVIAAIAAAGRDATRLVLGDHGVQVPLDAAAVSCYADK